MLEGLAAADSCHGRKKDDKARPLLTGVAVHATYTAISSEGDNPKPG